MLFGLVSEAPTVKHEELVKIARAIKRQIDEHVGPVWNVSAEVEAYPKLKGIPPHCSPVLISDKFKFESQGVHLHREYDDRPFGLLKANKNISVEISHEIIEMLTDPTGDRVVSGPSPVPGQGTVQYLLEVCDPPESDAYAYKIGRIKVSDFCTPAYYDVDARPGSALSHTGAITRPLEVLRKGYITWHEPVTGA